jgi:chemotaxis-related protein WspB
MEEGASVVAFSIGAARYGVDVAEVLAIVPRIATRALEGTPPWVEGLMPISGGAVPLIDLVRLHTGVPARRAFSTRVILVRYPVPGGGVRTLGLVAEHVTDVARLEPGSVQPTGIAQAGAPWLGDVGRLAQGDLLQLVTVPALLTDDARAVLFPPGEERG